MRIRRPLGGTRAQTVIRGALLVSIASVLAVVNTAACATAPRMRERAPGVRSLTEMPYNMATLSDLDFRLLFCMERGDFWALLGRVWDR